MLRRTRSLVLSCLIAASQTPSARAAPFEAYAEINEQGELFKQWNAAHGDPYALDDLKRFVEWTGRGKPRIECDRAAMVAYSGSTLHYAGRLVVDPAFRERLARFEAVVAEVGKGIYGRAPRSIRHYGAFSCRASRHRSYRVSEHALGNAIDVVGFDFGAAGKTEALPGGLPRSLRLPFQIRIARHWRGTTTETGELHERFLHELTSRLEERPDIFRILIGPGHGNHADHFHFDASPWRYIDL